jgi:hypothetical protein
MTATSHSPLFKLRDYAAVAIFLFSLLQNLGTYWKETNKHHVHVQRLSSSSSSSPLSPSFLEHDQKYDDQQYFPSSARSAAVANEYPDYSRRIAATITTKAVVYNHTTTTTTAAYFNDDTEAEQTTPSIRRWGCNLHQTPLIYIHIGNAGE